MTVRSALLDRLAVCNAEWITGVDAGATTYRLPPSITFKTSELPIVYCDPPSYNEQGISGDYMAAIYTVTMPVLIESMERLKQSSTGIPGAVTTGDTLQGACEVYYQEHRQLSTTAGGGFNDLGFVAKPIQIQIARVGVITTPYGSFVGFVPTLTVYTM